MLSGMEASGTTDQVGSNREERIRHCADVIRHYQQPGGAYPASPNFKSYSFCWFRDGAFIANAMSLAGDIESAEEFFDWCSNVVNNRRDHILSGGLMDARYTYDGLEDDVENWEKYQLDGYGTWLWAAKEHSVRHGRSLERFQEAIGLTQHYLAVHWQEPCLDWWEERSGTHAASLSCIYAGLLAFDHPEASNVRKAIDLSGERTDGSLLVCPLLDAVSDEQFAPVLARIEDEIVGPDGGVYRYRDDVYFGGGQWPLLSCFLGLNYLKQGRYDDLALPLAWVESHIDEQGWLPEQISDNVLHPDGLEQWQGMAGPSANPLLWSNAMYVTLASLIR